MSSPAVVETQKEHDSSQPNPDKLKTKHPDSVNTISKGQNRNDHNKNMQVPTDIAIDNLNKEDNGHK